MMNSTLEKISCAHCKSDIENTSFYCDQCGNEIRLCETCGLTGKDSWCEQDGGEMKAAKEFKLESNTTAEQIYEQEPHDQYEATAEEPRKQEAPKQSNPVSDTHTELMLISRKSEKKIQIRSNTVLGRTQGDYTAFFGNEKTVSGKHLQIDYSSEGGWTVIDLDTTNRTKLARESGQWRDITPLIPHKKYQLSGYNYLLIADLEFTIQLSDPHDAKTTRV